ncbi:hypothetical protein TSUD_270790 [Trifolium subterraneum]|uniref:Uncharacterized protein n=1 Tax=Trifolium subterraneum TaxID=3900 RepID=A0A2Z6MH53_TRISU|nr:hypothetical protein TSUD_270790 [Trifolium subterraneum]
MMAAKRTTTSKGRRPKKGDCEMSEKDERGKKNVRRNWEERDDGRKGEGGGETQ